MSSPIKPDDKSVFYVNVTRVITYNMFIGLVIKSSDLDFFIRCAAFIEKFFKIPLSKMTSMSPLQVSMCVDRHKLLFLATDVSLFAFIFSFLFFCARSFSPMSLSLTRLMVVLLEETKHRKP